MKKVLMVFILGLVFTAAYAQMDNPLEDYIKYQDSPIVFGEEVLGETYTEEVKALMESVRDNPITLAKSANAVGKTHAAARVSVWWYKCFPDSQIFTGAAPP